MVRATRPGSRGASPKDKIPGVSGACSGLFSSFSLRDPIFGRISSLVGSFVESLVENYAIGIGSAPIIISRIRLLTIDSIRT